MVVTGSPFCEHGKLRMSCATCKAAARPPGDAPGAKPYVATHEREAPAPAKRTTAPRETPLGGPAKPLLPQRRRKKPVTAEDEARAEAWWVKKG